MPAGRPSLVNDEQRQAIRDLHDDYPKMTFVAIGRRFSIKRNLVASIINYRSRADIVRRTQREKRPVPPPNVMPGITLAQLTARR